MPEQIALAEKRGLPDARFFVGDASPSSWPMLARTSSSSSASSITWSAGARRRLLRPEGLLVIEEHRH
jgi:hypothetical protein